MQMEVVMQDIQRIHITVLVILLVVLLISLISNWQEVRMETIGLLLKYPHI